MPPESTNYLAQYSNVFIPLGVSIVTGIISFFVYKSKVDRLEQDVKEIRLDCREVRDKVIKCETALDYKEPLTKRKSPVTLTDRGNRILIESGGQSFVDKNYEELKQKIEKEKPATSYDIQETAKQVIDEIKDDTRINPIKEYLFKEGMEIGDIIVVLGIYLRDKILKERGVTVDDIDKYDPEKKTETSRPSR